MNTKLKHLSIVLLSAGLSLVNMACAAQYQTIRAADPARANSEDATGKTAENAPHAGVEVIYDNKVVTKVPVNEPFTIRPTKTTKDWDDKDVEDCKNPGIVSAEYDIDGDKKSVARENGECSDLGITYTDDNEGKVKIKLKVKSDEGETAEAETTIEVVALKDLPTQESSDDVSVDAGDENGDDTGDDVREGGSDDSVDSSDGGSSSTDGSGGSDGSDGTDGGSSPTDGGSDGSKGPGQHPGQSPHQSK